MNSMKIPSKRSTLEKKLDKLIIALFSTLLCMCLLGAIGRFDQLLYPFFHVGTSVIFSSMLKILDLLEILQRYLYK